MKNRSPVPACPCGQTDHQGHVQPRSACCGPYLDGSVAHGAPNAVVLMRSRYSAFVERNTAYLLLTWHPSTRPVALDLDLACHWLGLEVRSSKALGERDAEVEFVARSRHAGRGQRLHERSHFVFENDRWFYVDGEFLS